jgi:1-acyl-sn-glycerol-3-phosphate acyltransferase
VTFKWLPDAERDPHPRRTWLAECAFDLTVRALFRKEEILPADYRLDCGTFVVSNHQRDADVPVLTTVLCRREGFHIRWPLPFFASREDFFQARFLERLLYAWPWPLRRLLGAIPLGWFFRIVRCQPLRRVREFTLKDALRELPRDYDLAEALNARGQREVGAKPKAGEQPVKLRFWGLRRLGREARQRLAPDFRLNVTAQLEYFASRLDAGRSVYFAPEGTISGDGRLRRVRAGPYRVAQLAAAPPPILPVALSYDPLGPGRLRVIIRVGEPFQSRASDNRAAFDAILEREIRELYPVNASHLLGRFLMVGPETFSRETLSQWLRQARECLRKTSLTLDPALLRADCDRLAERRLGWLERKGLVKRDGVQWHNCCPRDVPPGWDRPAAMVRYLDNALDDYLEALAPDLELRP